uniref:Secreted protein n=1 Tax=Caenorhabditis tropicalis TaxID=1561998 RepID=A0A1I7TAD5_9PELO
MNEKKKLTLSLLLLPRAGTHIGGLFDRLFNARALYTLPSQRHLTNGAYWRRNKTGYIHLEVSVSSTKENDDSRSDGKKCVIISVRETAATTAASEVCINQSMGESARRHVHSACAEDTGRTI